MSKIWHQIAEATGIGQRQQPLQQPKEVIPPLGQRQNQQPQSQQPLQTYPQTPVKMGQTQTIPPMQNALGQKISSQSSIGQNPQSFNQQASPQTPRNLDPGVARGTTIGTNPSPGLARASNADSQDRPNTWDTADKATESFLRKKKRR